MALAVLATPAMAKDILTATPVTYMLATELTRGTALETEFLPPKRYGMNRLPNWFASKGAEATVKAAQGAQAVITLSAVWPADPLYVHARQGNIRIVEIDASQAISPRAQGVAALRLADGSISPYSWLNPANITRMAAIVGQDLQKIWPEHADRIAVNQQALMLEVRQLINQQQQALFEAEVDSVILLSSELEDFASGNQLFVVERYTRPEIEWSKADKQAFVELLNTDKTLWLLSAKKLSASMKAMLPENVKVMVIDSVDRWGREGIDAKEPLQRWEIRL
ncbi:ABC transporter substrate-binding protein [Photobacterium aquae]|uniref:ABC transporter substrate-binding protein n=2 Tax=Photobacterium aquae TaxID=1195763 RepID=A0A0J1GX89_9GAMM|nr:zinc ABC transporter substrate-binding protein [Photobacterium aquae]KLV04260.1 ABC transporter substrate-binding protein [Photobacterium aquae]